MDSCPCIGLRIYIGQVIRNGGHLGEGPFLCYSGFQTAENLNPMQIPALDHGPVLRRQRKHLHLTQRREFEPAWQDSTDSVGVTSQLNRAPENVVLVAKSFFPRGIADDDGLI